MIFMSVNSFVKYCFVCFYNSWMDEVLVHTTDTETHMEYIGEIEIVDYIFIITKKKKNTTVFFVMDKKKPLCCSVKNTWLFFVFEISKFNIK